MKWIGEIVMVTSTMIQETRRESITYRTNLARLMNQLIKDGKTDKAKKS
jgi:hypothetical protein